jgi:predicted nucleotidyltransferase
MTQHEALAILQAHADDIRRRGVTALYLYGSFARDRATESSDVDLFADVDYARFGFVPFMDLREDLAAWLGRKVDFTTRNGLHRDLRDRVAAAAIKVFDDGPIHSIAAE